MSKDVTVIYICDGLGCNRQDCRLTENYSCSHTSNPKHARYDICKDPWNYPERFEQVSKTEYWERERR